MKVLELPEYELTPLEAFLTKKTMSSLVRDTVRNLTRGEYMSEHQLSNFDNKSRLAHMLYPDLTFDSALPQLWLNHWDGREYRSVLTGTVWAYPKEEANFGLPFPVTEEANHLIRSRE